MPTAPGPEAKPGAKAGTRAPGAGRGKRRGGPARLPPADAARTAALHALRQVTEQGAALEDALEGHPGFAALEGRDRGFARMLAATALRRMPTLDAALNAALSRPLAKAKPPVQALLRLAAAEIIALDTPGYAAVDQAVRLARSMQELVPFAALANAVLRKVAAAPALPADPVADLPRWMADRWKAAWGADRLPAIAATVMSPPPLDISVKADAAMWAERLGGTLLPTGSVRLTGGRIEELPGFAEGGWWVQDAAAALPARLLGDIAGKTVVDLCAAPGGKTMQLAAMGARVTAVDLADSRLDRLRENLARTGLSATVVAADALTWTPADPADAVLLDAPCTATGTVRRHPEILRNRRPRELEGLTAQQTRLIDAAFAMLKRGGTLVYATCSLEPEEGERQADAFLARQPDAILVPVTGAETGLDEVVAAGGYLRVLPSHMGSLPAGHGGMDGFFAARFRRR